MTRVQTAGVLAVSAGAVLVISLLLGWWSLPGDLVDPPADAPSEIEMISEGYKDGPGIVRDGFEFFDFRDVVWLITGIAAFIFGLATLVGKPAARPLGFAVAGLALVSIVLLAITLISPPDFFEIIEDRGASYGIDYDLPLTREIGPWVALAASLGVLASAVLGRRRS